eukprot:462287_1
MLQFYQYIIWMVLFMKTARSGYDCQLSIKPPFNTANQGLIQAYGLQHVRMTKDFTNKASEMKEGFNPFFDCVTWVQNGDYIIDGHKFKDLDDYIAHSMDLRAVFKRVTHKAPSIYVDTTNPYNIIFEVEYDAVLVTGTRQSGLYKITQTFNDEGNIIGNKLETNKFLDGLLNQASAKFASIIRNTIRPYKSTGIFDGINSVVVSLLIIFGSTTLCFGVIILYLMRKIASIKNQYKSVGIESENDELVK